MLALNSFPGVICGHVEDPVDAYTFAHVNDGNAVALPFAKGFGWGGELNLEYIFEKLFGYNIGSTAKKPNNYKLNIDTSKTRQVGTLTDLSARSDSALKNLLTQARPGDFLQVRRSHGGSHSMIVLSTSSTDITVYECNVDGANGIRTATYTWASFRSVNAAVGLYTARDYSLHR